MKKLANLLVLSIMLFCSTVAMADIVNGVRTKPVPQGASATYELDCIFYLYNIESGLFFTAGNDWNTRASVAEYGQEVYFTVTDAALDYDNDVVELKNYVPKFGSFLSAFADAPDGVWTDNNSNERRFWRVTEGDYGCRISNVAFDDLFLGVDVSKADTRLYLISDDSENSLVDWQLVTWDNYQTYKEAMNCYVVAERLKDIIGKADSLGVNVSSALRIYLNENASVDELENAILDVQEALSNIDGQAKDVTNDYITNPSYEYNSNEGWEGTYPGFESYDNAEFWNKDFEYYQNLYGLKPGVYSLGVQAFYRPGSLGDAYGAWLGNYGKNVEMYVDVDGERFSLPLQNIYDGAREVGLGVGTEVWLSGVEPQLYCPNNMRAAQGYFQAGRYQNTLFFNIEESSQVRIGLDKSNLIYNDWTIWDNWTLNYYGSGDAAYSLMAASIAEKCPDYSDAIATQSLKDSYMLLRSNPIASNAEEAKAYVNELHEAQMMLEENIACWALFIKRVEDATQLYARLQEEGKENVRQVQVLAYYIQTTAPEIKNSRSKDSDEILAEVETLNAIMDAAMYLQPSEGEDVTRYLNNPDFSMGSSGWIGWGTASNNSSMPTTGGSPNICAESYNANNFDLYQEVTGDVPVGVYEISVQGFTRIGRNDSDYAAAWHNYMSTGGQTKMPVYVYLNNNATNFKDIHEEPELEEFYENSGLSLYSDYDGLSNEGYYEQFGYDDILFFPNTMSGASYAFTKGKYVNSAFGAVVNTGDMLRVGVKGSTNGANWSIFDNFKLTFWGKRADKVFIALDAAVAEMRELQNSGRMGKNVLALLDDAISEAEAVKQSSAEDGEALFTALCKLYEMKSEALASSDLMNELANENEYMYNKIWNYDMSSLLNSGLELFYTINNRLDARDINDDEVEGLIEQIYQYNYYVDVLENMRYRMYDLEFAAPSDYELAEGIVSDQWYGQWKNLYDEVFTKMNGYEGEGGMSVNEVDNYIKLIDQLLSIKYDVVEEGNMLYVQDGLRLSKSGTNQLPVSLKNDDEIVGFQFDVVLPAGLSVAKNARGKLIVTVNGDRTESHSLSSNMVDDNTLRIVGTSMDNDIIEGVDGVLLNIGIDVASWVENGEYAILLKDVKLTNSDKQTLKCSDKTFIVKVGGMMGDVNDDETVDVTDAVLIIDHILLKNPANFDASVADVNADGDIDVTDVVMVIDAILGKIELSRGAEDMQKDLSAYTAFQMDLTIPAGYVLEGVELTEIAKESHKLAYNMLSDGRCRVVVFSMDNEALPGAWDEVIRLNLRGQGETQVNIDRAVFVTIDGQRHELMMNPTSIAQISNLQPQTSNLYDLQGRKVEKATKGILIENGRKTLRK